MTRVGLALLVAALGVPGAICPGGAGAAIQNAPDARDALPSAVVVVNGAQNVISRPVENTLNRLSVSYLVRAAYPAPAVLADIKARLEASTWKPLPMDWINPTKRSSHKVGWRSHVVSSPPRPEVESFVWSAQWSNPAGDVVVYMLTYKSGPPSPNREGPKPDNDDLRVHVLLMRDRLVPIEALPASLILLDGARDISAWRDRDMAYDQTGLRYTVAARYPPAKVMSYLTERLEKHGWIAFEDRPPWFPTSPSTSSGTPGWKAQSRRAVTAQFFEWKGNWRNQAGELAGYVLSYESSLPAPGTEASKPDNDDLHVEAILRSKIRRAEGRAEGSGAPTLGR